MATEPHAAFGDLLRHARREAGLTQEELAERAGVSTRAVSDLERSINRAPRRDTLELLADALELSPDDRAQWERARRRLAGRAQRGIEDWRITPSQLPASFTSFIGREREIDEVARLLRHPEIRLLTLTGAGGIGKTRLSIAVLERCNGNMAGGVSFVPLAPVGHPDLVPMAIAQSLGIREAPGQTILASISRYLRDREVLLLLDNVEHVAAGATFVGTLLQECPGLRVLATSRVALRLRGEQLYPLQPLSEDASTTLFVQRVRAVAPGFEPQAGETEAIAGICRRLDGLPLAIELAAARGTLLSPAALLRRLEHPLNILTSGPRDLPDRQQTLRATIAWSYDLLDSREQCLFRRLAVFMGGWTLDAAEAVGEDDVLNALGSLVDISLVERYDESGDEPRFRMLETIRELGLELLASHGEEPATRERHARYFAGLLARAPAFLIGPEQIAWLDRLEDEYANIQLALDWCLEQDIEAGLRMLGTLWAFWWLRTPLTAGRQYFDRFLERADDSVDPAVLAAALTGAGVITEFESDMNWDRAAALHEQALSIWLDLRDPPEGAYWSFLNLGGIAERRGKLQEAEAYFEQTLEYARRRNEPIGITAGLLRLGSLVFSRGQIELAIRHYQDGLVLARELQDPFLTAAHLGNLGHMFYETGRVDEAYPMLEESLALNRAVKLTRRVAVTLENLADLAFLRGQFTEARRLLEESLSEARKVNDVVSVGWAKLGLGKVALECDEPGEALDLFRQGLLACHSGGAHHCVASAAEWAAMTHARTNNLGLAVQLFAWASAFRERLGVPQRPHNKPALEGGLAFLHDHLPPAEFDAVWEAGTRLSLDQVCEEHLG